MRERVPIRRLATGVPGLDTILGGGLPELSFNLIVGPPGSGKTTLAHQLMFALTAGRRRASFFTVLGEPPLKMLRYQQQFAFFDADRVAGDIRFINLSEALAGGDVAQVLARIAAEVESHSPALVVIDSFRSAIAELDHGAVGASSQQRFIQQLGVHLSTWQVTSFMVGEYPPDRESDPIFTVADGVLRLGQATYHNSMVRRIEVLKMRGQASRPGPQPFRISQTGIEIYPAAVIHDDAAPDDPVASYRSLPRLTMGVPGLDDMLGGGLPAGYSLLVAGPSGSGKTILATAFLAEGVRLGEPGVLVAFEQSPSQSKTRTLDDMVRAGEIGLINTRPLDLSIDEIVQRLVESIRSLRATRVVIDSLSGFELAVAPTFRQDFRQSLFRMVAALSRTGVTVLLTSELEDRYTDLRFSPYGSAFLTDAIIVQRYVVLGSTLRRVLAVVKVRGSAHSGELREFEITDDGIALGDRVLDYEGVLSARPQRTS